MGREKRGSKETFRRCPRRVLAQMAPERAWGTRRLREHVKFQSYRGERGRPGGIADLQKAVIGSLGVLVNFLPIFSRIYLGLRTSENQVAWT